MSLADTVTELETRAQVMEDLAGSMLATIKINLNCGHLKAIDEESDSTLRRLVKSWSAHFDLHRAGREHEPAPDAPPPGKPLFPDGLPLRFSRGVYQAIFADASAMECVISEGLDYRHVFYLGTKGHLMVIDQVLARQLAPLITRFGETGKLPSKTLTHGTNPEA